MELQKTARFIVGFMAPRAGCASSRFVVHLAAAGVTFGGLFASQFTSRFPFRLPWDKGGARCSLAARMFALGMVAGFAVAALLLAAGLFGPTGVLHRFRCDSGGLGPST